MSVGKDGWLSMASLHGAVEQVEKSHFVLVQVMDAKPCPLLAMQVGLAVMLGKTIVVLSVDDAEVPELLKKVAFHVDRCGATEEETRETIRRVCELVEAKQEQERKERQRRAEIN